MHGVFITGTDTEVGKTQVTVLLLRALAEAGIDAAPMKPVAAGATEVDGRWLNEDIEALLPLAAPGATRESLCPFLLRKPAAPNLAAAHEHQSIDLDTILAGLRRLRRSPTTCAVVEGVGGWLCPFGDDFDARDLCSGGQLDVLLVVGLRLGCINHARLTEAAIRTSGVRYLGWVANRLDPAYGMAEETVAYLRTVLDGPCLAEIPTLERDASAASLESLQPLIDGVFRRQLDPS